MSKVGALDDLSKYPSLGPQDAVEEVALGFRVQGTMIKAISSIVKFRRHNHLYKINMVSDQLEGIIFIFSLESRYMLTIELRRH